MIPPVWEIRQKSIRRWLQDQQPARFAQLTRSGELEAAILEIDQQMDLAFEEAENEVRDRLTRQDLWGRPEGLQQYQTERLMLWGEIRARFLPVISEQE